MAEKHISLPKPFASGDAKEWFQRFEICCNANRWNNDTKAVKLPTLLEGEAIAVWLELTAEQQADYAVAKERIITALMICFIGTVSQTEDDTGRIFIRICA